MHRSTRLFADALPVVAAQRDAVAAATLDWVGMRALRIPIRLREDATAPLLIADVDIAVNLPDPQQRGIHMSRLYAQVDTTLSAQFLAPARLRQLLDAMLATHAGLANRARVRLAFELPMRRAALRSDAAGWRAYPVWVAAVSDAGKTTLECGLTLCYASTCPASAALARASVAEGFDRASAREGGFDAARAAQWLREGGATLATAHAQRSTLRVRARLAAAEDAFAFEHAIDGLEAALATPVQTAVKRVDEQAFAELNGANTMFCEDAARRAHAALSAMPAFDDFALLAIHHESLHAHDAYAGASKGVANGLTVNDVDVGAQATCFAR
jgi:GTP cyclohydrolase I